MEGSQQAARAQGRPADGATTERVAQAAQLFANLTQPGERPRNGDQAQPVGDPEASERPLDNRELLQLLQAALAANERTEKTVEQLRHDLTMSNVRLQQAALAANERTEKTVEVLRHDLDTTMSNVKLLHTAVRKTLSAMGERVVALERNRPPEDSDPG